MAESAGGVTVVYEQDGQEVTEHCELLVVACDPRDLFAMEHPGRESGKVVMVPTPEETEIFSTLTDFVFQTTIVTVPGAGIPGRNPPEYGAMLDPATVMEMKGFVSGFRNETAKQYTLEAARKLERNHVVVYQLWGPSSKTPRPTEDEMAEMLHDQLPTLSWWPYGDAYELQGSRLHTSYFHHWEEGALEPGHAPWDLLGIQGDHRTLYVHAAGCFESVVQCWQYQDLLLSPGSANAAKLPADRSARIVILGAGVSGLLFAERLRRLGYTGVVLIERDPDHIGGKTHSVHLEGPKPEGTDEWTVCELGTCYLSPAYDELATYLAPYTRGDEFHEPNERRGFRVSAGEPGEFRGMVTTGTMKWKDEVVAYDDYIVLRAEQAVGDPLSLDDRSREKMEMLIGASLLAYYEEAKLAIGTQLPMPSDPPESLLQAGSFLDWLKASYLFGVIGVMEYAYSVQGYGPLSVIPAYYGLVWISPVLALRLVDDSIEDRPIVTFWSKGWGDVWRRMSETMDIRAGAVVTSIQRSSVPAA